jgi:hypothetical protein
MYLVPFTNKYLKKFEVTLRTTVKRLAGLAKSTATDLLFDQGLTNVFNLQALSAGRIHAKCSASSGFALSGYLSD